MRLIKFLSILTINRFGASSLELPVFSINYRGAKFHVKSPPLDSLNGDNNCLFYSFNIHVAAFRSQQIIGQQNVVIVFLEVILFRTDSQNLFDSFVEKMRSVKFDSTAVYE